MTSNYLELAQPELFAKCLYANTQNPISSLNCVRAHSKKRFSQTPNTENMHSLCCAHFYWWEYSSCQCAEHFRISPGHCVVKGLRNPELRASTVLWWQGCQDGSPGKTFQHKKKKKYWWWVSDSCLLNEPVNLLLSRCTVEIMHTFDFKCNYLKTCFFWNLCSFIFTTRVSRIIDFGQYLDNKIRNMLKQKYCCVRKCSSSTWHLMVITKW